MTGQKSQPFIWMNTLVYQRGAEQAFSHFIKNSLLDEVKPSAAHFINIDAQDSVQELSATPLYCSKPRLILFVGVGENGHIAFNDPWVADFNDKAIVKKVQLDTQCRQQQVNDGCFSQP